MDTIDPSQLQPVTDADFGSLSGAPVASAPPATAATSPPVDANMLTNGSLPPSTYPAVADPNRDDNPNSNGEIPQAEPAPDLSTGAGLQPVTDADFETPSLPNKIKEFGTG
jgi:hypothetical protein